MPLAAKQYGYCPARRTPVHGDDTPQLSRIPRMSTLPERSHMADDEVVDPDTVVTDAGDSQDATGGTAPDKDTAGATEELFFGKYKSKEEAEKGFKEAERALRSAQEELARERREATLAKVLEKVAAQ